MIVHQNVLYHCTQSIAFEDMKKTIFTTALLVALTAQAQEVLGWVCAYPVVPIAEGADSNAQASLTFIKDDVDYIAEESPQLRYQVVDESDAQLVLAYPKKEAEDDESGFEGVVVIRKDSGQFQRISLRKDDDTPPISGQCVAN